MGDVIIEEAYKPPLPENQEYAVPDTEIFKGLGTIAQQTDPEIRKLFATSLAGKWGREAVPHIVDIIANGSGVGVDLPSAAIVLTQAATPENIVDFCRMTTLEPVVRSSDRTINRSVFRMIEKYGDAMPEQDKAKATTYLWKSIRQLQQYREELTKGGDESQVMRVDWDIYATVSALVAVDFHELSLIRHLAVDDTLDEDLQDNIAQFVEKLTHPDKPSASSTTLTPEQWKKDIARLVRRAAIHRYLDGKSTLSEVKEQVRAFEQETGANDVIDALVTDDVIIDPKVGGVTSELSELIIKQFPKVKALVLMGSAVHGGAAIRTLTESQGEKDLDWGIITTKSMTKEEVDEIIRFAANQLGPLATKVGLPATFHSCDSINPSLYNVSEIQEPVEFLEMLEAGEINAEHMLLYLEPSYPSHVNEEQRKIILDAFAKLHETKPEVWEDVTDDIFSKWQEVHNLKKKHFSIAPKAKDKLLRRHIALASSELMAGPMADFLKEQTAESKDSKNNGHDSLEDQ